MVETRVKISSIVENQLPEYVKEEFPLIVEFLKQYYLSIDNQGSCLDILQNIDKYIKLEQLTSLTTSTTLTTSVDYIDNVITVSSTSGFPEQYGLLKIDNEVITYTQKTATQFLECARGFSGVTNHKSSTPDRLTFSQSLADTHDTGAAVENLSILFLKDFYKKVKTQFAPGFEDRSLISGLNENIFIKQSTDFYSSKGTDQSFKILFKTLYGESVEIIKPQDYLIQPSDATYRIDNELVVEAIQGDPQKLLNRTLNQDETNIFNKAYGSINNVEKIYRGEKEYYKLSLDYDYNRDITVTGSVFGKFSIHPKTKLITTANINDTALDVDSTVGFSTSGTLVVNLPNQTSLNIFYTSKSLNQFLGCSEISQTIPSGSEIVTNDYAYGYVGLTTDIGNLVKVRVTGVLSDIKIENSTFYFDNEDIIEIETLGKKSNTPRENNWIFNTSATYDVKDLVRQNSSSFLYTIETYDEHNFVLSDTILISSSNGSTDTSNIVSVQNKTQIVINVQSELNRSFKYKIRKILSKANFTNQTDLNNITTNVQNVYIDGTKSVYIASPSLPSYQQPLRKNDRSITFSASANGEELVLKNLRNVEIKHHFYTGDSVYYRGDLSTNRLNIANGIYFIKKINDSTIKLSYSLSNLYKNKYVSLSGDVSNNTFEISSFASKNLRSQKLLRKISFPIDIAEKVETSFGKTGILVNGVEILNYKSKDTIFYGSLEDIIVTSSGSDYDVINPPILTISDDNGSGATGFVEVVGKLDAINIIDGGFDYLDDPIITITGGNGSGAKAKAELAPFDHVSNFNSESQALLVNLTTDTIGFSSYHKFRDGEKVVYKTYGQTAVGGLSTDATYYVAVKDAFTVKVHKTYSDAIVGINTVDISSYGVGNHDFKSYERKKKIVNIKIVDSGRNYRNRKIAVSPVGINTFNDSVFAKNHGYSSGEIITYNSYGTPISGVSTGSYYVTKIDDENFKLSSIGTGSTSSDFYYSNRIFLSFSSAGIGTHEFNYPPISISVSGVIGVSTLTNQNYNAILQPIFRGEVKSVFLQSSGVGYGSSEILNYNKQPSLTLNSGSSAQIAPVVSNGRIQEVLVQSSGSNYNSPPTISISSPTGISTGFNLTPIIENGNLKEVKVINGGSNLIQDKISASVIASGFGAKFESRIQKWTVNLVERLFNQIEDDDGVIDEGINDQYELQYCHLYAPRKLRQLLFGSKVVSGSLVYTPDLTILNGKETTSDTHSPIIGWAYDGNPIYGPYGYASKTGGFVKALKSGYALLSSSSSRPNFPNGFFVEDYIFVGDGDLDEYNGRFCITPEFPNGIYAYFATVDESSVESSGPFINYRKPVFPYFIGNYYKSIPISGNFDSKSNQDNIDLLKTDFLRNTNPYGLNEDNSTYEFVNEPDKIQKQLTRIKNVSSGQIDDIKIISGGNNYKVNDQIIFDHTNTDGTGASARVYSIKGKTVKTISSNVLEISNVEFTNNTNNFIGFANSAHNLLNNDIISISGLSTFNSYLNSQFTVGIQSSILLLSNAVSTQTNTGMVTYFGVYGNLNYPNIRENDVYQIESEKIKIISIDKKSSRIKVIRGYSGTVGSAHSSTTSLIELSRKFNFTINSKSLNTSAKLNRQLYFDPAESLGLGTDANGRYVINFGNPGAGVSSLTVPTKTIYLPSHDLQTGDQIVYNANAGSPISISTNGTVVATLNDNDILYVAKVTDNLFSVSFEKVGLGSTGSFVGINSTTSANTLYFSGIGTGVIHSFTTNYPNKISGKVSRNTVTVSTASTHGLSLQDLVTVKCISGISTTYKVTYNDELRRLVINQNNFSSGAVNVSTNTITIINHGYLTGQAAIYSASTPSTGLSNNTLYYIIVIDNNNIQLARTYYDSTLEYPKAIDISTATAGTIGLVNPAIKSIENQTVIFDLSDSSLSYTSNSNLYSAFDFDLYLDKSYKNKFESTLSNPVFEVTKSGRIGIDSTANLSFKASNFIPTTLYYNLLPLKNIDNPDVKRQIISDDENILNNNELSIVYSGYTQTTRISGIGSTTFTYNITTKPEKSSYTNSEANITYDTTSISVDGEINGIQIISTGRGYKKLPVVSSVNSVSGKNAVLRTYGKNVGSIKNIKIEDIGFNYPTDKSLRPTGKVPQIFRVDPLFAFKSIGITSTGKNYITAPTLLVIDGYTNKVVDDVLLEYKLGDTKVNIVRNSKNLTNTTPKIIPLNNTNGIRINSISYNNSTKDVTLQLITNYSSLSDFPFNIGDEIFVENVSVGINSTTKGYNSSAYNYAYFTITSVTPNIGGSNASITYNLSDYLSLGETPGSFQPLLSAGTVVRKLDQPIFSSVLERNEFLVGEKVRAGNFEGIVRSWDSKSQLLKISTSDNFDYNQQLIGESSDSRSIIVEIYKFQSVFDVSSSSIVRNGWKDEKGFLNNSLYRIHDSDYYQYLSYSLRSKISYDKWSDPVNTLNHTAGFKKFSDLIIESKPTEFVGIITSQDNGYFTSVADLVATIDLNSVVDFDLAYERTLNISGNIVSDEIEFNSAVIQDYFESIGNRVLIIDDIGDQFSTNPRNTSYSVVDTFLANGYRTKKYLTLAKDQSYVTEKQVSIVTILTDGIDGYINQYAKNDTVSDLGSFDYQIFGNAGNLLFYPTKLFINNYDVSLLSIDIQNNITGIGTTNFGDVVKVSSTNLNIPAGTSSAFTLVGISSTYRSSKLLVEIHTLNDSYCQYSELNIIHNGSDVQLVEYGQLNNSASNVSGLGTYNAYISGSNLIVDLIPNTSIATSCMVNTVAISIANTTSTGVGTHTLNSGLISSGVVSISSTISPIKNKISGYSNPYQGAYYIVSIEDKTNNNYQMNEIIVTDDQTNGFIVNYGEIYTNSGLGTFGVDISGNDVDLMFTPNANIDVDVRVYQNSIKLATEFDEFKEKLDLNNFIYRSSSGFYRGTLIDVKRSFELTHKQNAIFVKQIFGNDPTIVKLSQNLIEVPNHFFVTGEKLAYSYSLGNSPIGIATTTITGIGTTSILPSNVYAIKVDDSNIRLAGSISDALKTIPTPLTLTSLGIGTGHFLKSINANNKVLISIDNVVQSPIISTATTTTTTNYVDFISNTVQVAGFTSFFGGDLIKIGDEIMKVNSVGVAGTNLLLVERPWMGTGIQTHAIGSSVQKILGNYNIVGNTINFYTSPIGEIPLGTTTNGPNDIDYLGITTHSSFSGRVFLRSGIQNTSIEPYATNYVFDDISFGFNGITTQFNLKVNGVEVSGISSSNPLVLINEIVQHPQRATSPIYINGDYRLTENVGITSVQFTGNPVAVNNDVKTSNVPIGGIIVSIASTNGFGYQPLVSAGGTAIVSLAGTIQSISIGNSGSGYRSGIQTVNVGIATSTVYPRIVEYIGIASVLNGNIVGVSITNPGAGYTSSNPPIVIFDSPLSYSNLPLIYSGSTPAGVGTGAKVNIVVGQGSSVIDFEIANYGYAYGVGQKLTVSAGGTTGIPTTSSASFNQFEITIDNIQTDKFFGINLGDFEVLDPLDDLFNGSRISFPIKANGIQKTIRAKSGSPVQVKATLLVFINDILQQPDYAYTFNGGSTITFTESPKQGDTSKILFYTGTSVVDVIEVDILETIKEGDFLRFESDSLGLDEEIRTVIDINSSDSVKTFVYNGPGITLDEKLLRPIVWTRQTEDIFVDGKPVTKDRSIYNSNIQPYSRIIQNVGIGSTVIFVDNLKTFFENNRENAPGNYNSKLKLVSVDNLVSASATAVVSTSGTVSSISISDGGQNYIESPEVILQNPVGLGTTQRATAIASISNGIVTSISVNYGGIGYTSTNPPNILIAPPKPIVEILTADSYSGDFGIISGISTTSVGVASTALVFDLFVPMDSFLRNSSVVGSAITVSGIQTNYYFTVYNSNVGKGVTSLRSDGSTISIGNTFIDNVYEATSVSIAQTSVVGVGLTFVAKVTASISDLNNITGIGFSGFYGEFSWGRISSPTRSNPKQFNVYTNGLTGISTSAVIERVNPLRSVGYTTSFI